MRILPALALVSLFAVPSAGATAADATTDDGQKIVCKSQLATGSRFRKRICRTKAHWEAVAEQAKRDTAETINRPMISTAKGN